MAKNQIWYVCPSCRSRSAAERQYSGEIRCSNCSMLLRAAKGISAASHKDKGASPDIDDDDEYRLAPLREEAPAAQPQHRPAHSEPPVYHSELERLRARRDRVDDTGTPPPQEAGPTPAGKLTLDDFEIRDHERYKPEPPPRWTFFSGVFTYPWRPQSMLPWIALSIGLAVWGLVGLLAAAGLNSGTQGGTLMAGFLGLAWVWLTVLTGSYAAACVFAITETTAYNFDAPYDWPDPDWRERFFHFLWFGWCLGLAAALSMAPASLVGDDIQLRAMIVGIGTGLSFPIFVLSTLETNSLSPFSGPIWRSLLRDAATWICFFLLSGVILGGSGFATVLLYGRLGLLSVLILAPLLSAAILVYARLLGRLAWRIMEPEQLQLEAWRKAHQSTLAAEGRKKMHESEPPAE